MTSPHEPSSTPFVGTAGPPTSVSAHVHMGNLHAPRQSFGWSPGHHPTAWGGGGPGQQTEGPGAPLFPPPPGHLGSACCKIRQATPICPHRCSAAPGLLPRGRHPHTWMPPSIQVSPVQVNFPHKRASSTLISELLVLQFLKTILRPKGHVWGWPGVPPSQASQGPCKPV